MTIESEIQKIYESDIPKSEKQSKILKIIKSSVKSENEKCSILERILKRGRFD